MKIEKFSREEWAKYSADAHLAVFGKTRPAEWDRIDYALLYVCDDDLPGAYVTVRELSPKHVYWSFGGVFPWALKSIRTLRMIDALIAWQGQRSKSLITYVENDNFPMLKIFLSRKMKIVGTRCISGSVLVELVKEF